MSYAEFLARKAISHTATGIPDPPPLSPKLKPFQADVTRWALQKGRAALFEECGLGKSWQSIEWSRVVAAHTGKPVLILTPLAVAQQFVREGDKLEVPVQHVRRVEGGLSSVDADVLVTNYESLHQWEPYIDLLGGVVLDESSILKSYDGKTRTALIDMFRGTPFRLACTATPSPNDPVELGNHAEFLGAMRHVDMLNRFFEHDAGDTGNWVLKGHGRKPFWRWVSSWAVCMQKPSDRGYSDEGYDLPPLNVHEHVIDVDQQMARGAGLLFAYEAATLTDQRAVRRTSIGARVAKAAELTSDGEQWFVWAGLNDESSALTKAIDGAVEVTGSQPAEEKERRIVDFLEGRARVLVTKQSIAGFGINAQQCARQLFVGADHSFEQYWQAVRRSYRFGQRRAVDVHLIRTSADGRVAHNLERKRVAHEAMHRELVEVTRG